MQYMPMMYNWLNDQNDVLIQAFYENDMFSPNKPKIFKQSCLFSHHIFPS